MQRPCLPYPAVLRSAGLLLAAYVTFAGAAVVAQQASNDPLAPYLQTNPKNPPRFEKRAQAGQGINRPPLSPPIGFTPPASGAGDTGYNSTNSRKPKAGKAKVKAKTKSKTPLAAQAIAPGLPAPVAVSRYQTPPPNPAVANGAYAQAPGAPPVEFGPIRQPKKHKAHTEPQDPYAPLGVRSGAFTLFPAIELIGGYDTNPGRMPGGSGAWLYTVMPELQGQSNWSRHELKADLRGSYTGYSPDTSPTLSRPYFDGKVDGRIDVSQDTQSQTRHSRPCLHRQPRQSELAGRNCQAPDFQYLRR